MKIKTSKTDFIWSYLGYFFSYATNLIIVLFVMRTLETELLGLWYTFLSIGSLVQILDFGISVTLVRNVTYAWSGVSRIEKEGISSFSEKGNEPNYNLLGEILYASKNICFVIALVAVVVMGAVGTPYVFYVARGINHSDFLFSWVFFVIATFLNIYYIYWPDSLTGIGAIREAQIASVISRTVQIVISIIVAHLGGGLSGLSLAYLIMGFVLRIISKRFLYGYHGLGDRLRLSGMVNTIEQTKNIFRIIWYNAKKAGIVSFSTFLLNQTSTLVCSAYIGLAETASYGLCVQILNALAAVSFLWFKTETPMLISLKVDKKINELRKSFSLCIYVYYIVYMAGTVMISTLGIHLLKKMNYSTELPLGMFLFCALVTCLEYNHSIFCGYIAISNKLPYVKAAVISSVAVSLFTVISGMIFGNIYTLIFVKFIVQLAYNNWKWPAVVLKELDVTLAGLLRMGHREFVCQVWSKICHDVKCTKEKMMIKVKEILKKSTFICIMWSSVNSVKRNIENNYLRHNLLRYYKNNDDPEIVEIVRFLEKNRLYLYNYSWFPEYMRMDVRILFDDELDLKYFLHNNRRVYYNRSMGG